MSINISIQKSHPEANALSNKDIKEHFDSISQSYDSFKKNHPNYYGSVIEALKREIPEGKRILDFGCGTGQILISLKPSFGVGIDLSPKLIQIATEKYKNNKNISFKQGDKPEGENLDYIVMVDVVEHLSDIKKTLKEVADVSSKNTKLVISFVPHSWETVLEIMEKLKLKMPEGPHTRISEKEITGILKKLDFRLLKTIRVAPAPKIVRPILKVLNLTPVTILIFGRK